MDPLENHLFCSSWDLGLVPRMNTLKIRKLCVVAPASNLSPGEVKKADPRGSLASQRGSLMSSRPVGDSASEKRDGQHFLKKDS